MDALTIAAISVCAAEKRAAYRLIRKAWAAEIGFPFPKRKKRDIRSIVIHRDFGEIGRHVCSVAMLRQ